MGLQDLAFLVAAGLLAVAAVARGHARFVPALLVALYAANSLKYTIAGQSHWAAVELASGAIQDDTLRSGRWWELIAYSWLHLDDEHLLDNLQAIAVAGVLIESALGWRRIALLWTASILGGGLAIAVLEGPPVGSYAIGASGGAFGLMGAFLVLLVRQRLPGIHPNLHVLWAIPALLLSLLNSLAPDVSLAGHVGGLVVGGIAGAALLPEEAHRVEFPQPFDWKLVAGAPLFALGASWVDWHWFYACGLFGAVAYLGASSPRPQVQVAPWVPRAAITSLALVIVAPALALGLGTPWTLVPDPHVRLVGIEGSTAQLSVPAQSLAEGPLTASRPIPWVAGGVRGEASLISPTEFASQVESHLEALLAQAPVEGKVELGTRRCAVALLHGGSSTHRLHTFTFLEESLLLQTIEVPGGAPEAVTDLMGQLVDHPCARTGKQTPPRRDVALVAFILGDVDSARSALGDPDGAPLDPTERAIAGLLAQSEARPEEAAHLFADVQWDQVPARIRTHVALSLSSTEDPPISALRVAEELARHAVEERPHDPMSWDALAAAEARLGRFDDAVAHLEQALELEPKHWMASDLRYRRDLYRSGIPWTDGMEVPPEPAWTLDLGFSRLVGH